MPVQIKTGMISAKARHDPTRDEQVYLSRLCRRNRDFSV